MPPLPNWQRRLFEKQEWCRFESCRGYDTSPLRARPRGGADAGESGLAVTQALRLSGFESHPPHNRPLLTAWQKSWRPRTFRRDAVYPYV
ncbi:MAG: hypothetical protein JWN52_115 [Actinomycetia bacterium]|jgi:hypothetical protein|nr:hypothetical protein [Actinomycetes bacterium]